MRMTSVYPLSCFSFGLFAGLPGKRDYWENLHTGSRHHNTGSQLTGLARLSYNRKVNFCCVQLRCRDICKASQLGSCNQALSSPVYSQILHPLPWPHRFVDAPRTHKHTHNFSPPSTSSYPLLYIKWTLLYPCSLHTNIIQNNQKTILNRKPNKV